MERPLRKRIKVDQLSDGLAYILFPCSRPGAGDSAQIVLCYEDAAALYRDWRTLGCWQRTLPDERGHPRSVHALRYERDPDGTPWLAVNRRFYHPSQGGWETPRYSRAFPVVGGPRRSKVRQVLERSADPKLVFVLSESPFASGVSIASDLRLQGSATPAEGTNPVSLKQTFICIGGSRVFPGSRAPRYP